MTSRTRCAPIFLVLLAMLACGDDRQCPDAARMNREIERLVLDSDRKSFELTEVTPFMWTRVQAFDGYTPVAYIKEQTGLDFREAWWLGSDYVRETSSILVFTGEEGQPCFLRTKNDSARGASWYFGGSAFRQGGFQPADAVFGIGRAGGLSVVEPQ